MRKLIPILLILCLLLAGCAEDAPEVTDPVTQETQTEAALDFIFYDIDGNAYTLSDFQGKPVILNFWASWCGPCKSEMPDIEEAYKEYGDEIQFLIVNLTGSDTVADASAYIAEQGYTFPVFYDNESQGAALFSVSSIPVTYFIDESGNVVAYASGTMSASRLQQGIDLLLPAGE